MNTIFDYLATLPAEVQLAIVVAVALAVATVAFLAVDLVTTKPTRQHRELARVLQPPRRDQRIPFVSRRASAPPQLPTRNHKVKVDSL